MKPKWTNMLVRSRHHSPPSVSGPKSAPKAIAYCGVGAIAETPRSTMTANTKTLAAMRAMVMGKEGCESVWGGGGSEVRMVCACWRSQAGQLRDGEESPRLLSNTWPQAAQRWRDMRRNGNRFFGTGRS